MPFTADLINSERRRFRYEIVWEKAAATGFLNARRMPMKIHENILVFYRRLPTYNPQMRTGYPASKRQKAGGKSSNYGNYNCDGRAWDGTNGERYPVDIIKFNQANCSTEPKLHPTQKPVPLLEWLIKTYTNAGDTVLDMCMGSGSTGIACKNTGRNFIGMELYEHYFEIARQRIEESEE